MYRQRSGTASASDGCLGGEASLRMDAVPRLGATCARPAAARFSMCLRRSLNPRRLRLVVCHSRIRLALAHGECVHQVLVAAVLAPLAHPLAILPLLELRRHTLLLQHDLLPLDRELVDLLLVLITIGGGAFPLENFQEFRGKIAVLVLADGRCGSSC